MNEQLGIRIESQQSCPYQNHCDLPIKHSKIGTDKFASIVIRCRRMHFCSVGAYLESIIRAGAHESLEPPSTASTRSLPREGECGCWQPYQHEVRNQSTASEGILYRMEIQKVPIHSMFLLKSRSASLRRDPFTR